MLIAAEELRATVIRAIRDQVDLVALLGDDLGGSLARATPLGDHGAAGLLLLLLALGVQAARADVLPDMRQKMGQKRQKRERKHM